MKRILWAVAGASWLGVSNFAEADLSKLPAAAKKEGVSYEKDIKAIFEASCFGCHGADRQRGGLRLDSLEAALKGGEDGKVIEAGKSEKSPLVIAVAQIDPETAMPPKRGGRGGRGGPGGPGGGPRADGPPAGGGPGGPRQGGPGGPGGPGGRGPSKPLTTEQVALVRAWIDQGAK